MCAGRTSGGTQSATRAKEHSASDDCVPLPEGDAFGQDGGWKRRDSRRGNSRQGLGRHCTDGRGACSRDGRRVWALRRSSGRSALHYGVNTWKPRCGGGVPGGICSRPRKRSRIYVQRAIVWQMYVYEGILYTAMYRSMREESLILADLDTPVGATARGPCCVSQVLT